MDSAYLSALAALAGSTLDDDSMNPLRDFSNACREELRGPDPP
jgi:hypothetical protein